MAETDLSAWLSIADAALVIGCSKRTVERLGRAQQLEARLRRQEGTPPVLVFSPESVAEEAQRRRRAPAPFVLREGSNGNGNEHRVLSNHRPAVDNTLATLPPDDDPIRQLFAAALRAVLSPPSPPVAESVAETGFLTLAEASAYIKLPQADLRRLVEAGELPVRKTGRGGLRFRRKDLEAL